VSVSRATGSLGKNGALQDEHGNPRTGGGKWVADYRDHSGKRHWESFDTRKEAERVLARHVTANKDGRHTPANDKRTVEDAFGS
jgi:hypothetical protein